jgi:hypothetical protein
MADRGVDLGEASLVLLEHLLLRAGLADIDLHDEEAVLGRFPDLRHGDPVRDGGHRRHLPVAVGEGGTKARRAPDALTASAAVCQISLMEPPLNRRMSAD